MVVGAEVRPCPRACGWLQVWLNGRWHHLDLGIGCPPRESLVEDEPDPAIVAALVRTRRRLGRER